VTIDAVRGCGFLCDTGGVACDVVVFLNCAATSLACFGYLSFAQGGRRKRAHSAGLRRRGRLPLGQPQSPVSPKTGRGVAGCPRGGGRRKRAHSAGLRRRGRLPPTKKQYKYRINRNNSKRALNSRLASKF
jgi:hypothetical protein